MSERTLPDGVETVATNLEIPWSIAFSPQGDLYFTEREGRLYVLKDGNPKLIQEFEVEAKKNDEGGLLGLAFHPDFERENYLYLYYTNRDEREVWNRISRFPLEDDQLKDEEIVLDNIPGGRVHNGGRIKFGPDGKLYATTGETWKREKAQDLDFLGGKILRLNPDGSIPEDNPFEDSLIYSYGNRNAQGLGWHPETRDLYASEHGPSGENGCRAHDEINIIRPGGNYGWPHIIGEGGEPEFIDPIYHTGDDTWAPSGICFYTGDKYPGWKGLLLVANLRGRHLRAIKLEGQEQDKLAFNIPLYNNELGRLRDVEQGNDDYLYLCTSNRDGRGEPKSNDDMIVKIINPPLNQIFR
jgi:glucose/arabinose dehydrogenase